MPPANADPSLLRRIMYFIYFRAEPWEKEVRDYENVPSYPPPKRKEAEIALIKLTRSGMQLPANPLPAGCAFDSARDGASFEVFLAIMRDCWREKNVSGVAVVLHGREKPRSYAHVQERPPMIDVFHRIEKLHEDICNSKVLSS